MQPKAAVAFAYGDGLKVNQSAKSGKVGTLSTSVTADSSENESEEYENYKWIIETSDMPDT